jgi:hypothetical protein
MFADYMRSKQFTRKVIRWMFNGDIGEPVTGHDKETCILRALDQLPQHPQLLMRLCLHRASKDAAGYASERTRATILVMQRKAVRSSTSERDTVGSKEHDRYQFCELPSFEDCKERLSRYIDATGHQAMTKMVCASCARLDFTSCFVSVPFQILEIPNQDRLAPAKPHAAHVLHAGLLFHPMGVITADGTVTLCLECVRYLRRNKVPRFALSKGFWIGDVPFVIARLSFPERLLIALCFPRVYLIKLFPKDKKARHISPDQRNDALRGNVSSVEMPHSRVLEMLSGSLSNVVPQHPRILADVLSVAYVGLGKLPPIYLRGFFSVSRRNVYDALLWLKDNNFEYTDVEISHDILYMLPENDVPREIIVREDVDIRVAEYASAEGAGYAPEKDLEGADYI